MLRIDFCKILCCRFFLLWLIFHFLCDFQALSTKFMCFCACVCIEFLGIDFQISGYFQLTTICLEKWKRMQINCFENASNAFHLETFNWPFPIGFISLCRCLPICTCHTQVLSQHYAFIFLLSKLQSRLHTQKKTFEMIAIGLEISLKPFLYGKKKIQKKTTP